MNEHKRNLSEINLTIKRDPVRLSIMPLKSVVSKLILQFKQTSLSRRLSGKYMMHICLHTRKFKDSSWRSWWKTKRIKDLFSKLLNRLKTLFILFLWRELLKLWNVWLSRMLTKKSLRTTNTMKTRLKKLRELSLAQFYPYGGSQLNVAERSMSLQFAGIQDIETCSQSVMVLMISWSKIQV